MQLFLQTENLSDGNSKMSIVETPETVTEKLRKNDLDKMPDVKYEVRNSVNETSNDNTTKDDGCVDSSGLEKLDRSNKISEISVCNGKVNDDRYQCKLIEDTSENNNSNKNLDNVHNDKGNSDETRIVDSSISTVNKVNEIIVTGEITDSNGNFNSSKTNESISSKPIDNLYNGIEIPVADESFSKELNKIRDCDKFPTEKETVATTEDKERNILLKETDENKTENDLVNFEPDKIKAPTPAKNLETIEKTRSDLDNPIATENALVEIKTENEAQSDEQNVQMTSLIDKSNEPFQHSTEIKTEVCTPDTEIGCFNGDRSFISSNLENSLDNNKTAVESINLKTESEDVEEEIQLGQSQYEKHIFTTDIAKDAEKECNEKISSIVVSPKVPVDQVIDSQINQINVEKKIEELSSSDKSSEINNEGNTTDEITATNKSNNVILSGNGDECKKNIDNNIEHQVTNDIIENSKETLQSNTYTSSDIPNSARLPDVVHEIVERNDEKHHSKEKELSNKTVLANTLDILSDSDDESQKSNTVNTSEKQCINLVDDDDIMLVDDDSMSRDQLMKEVDSCHTISENNIKDLHELKSEELQCDEKIIEDCRDDITTTTDNFVPPAIETDDIKIVEKSDEIKLLPEPEKPLVPIDFMKYCKPILSEMTRDHLEEFCLQRIVESIVDRSNFSEVKTKLKVMAQNCEEWRKKAMMLSKQNRDLQIVLKTVQEEQKKKSAEVIAPLRITRSVGMQVYMVEPNRNDANTTRGRRVPPANRWRGAAPASGAGCSAGANLGVGRGTSGTGLRGASSPAIPVPRLVPAPTPVTNSPAKTARTPPPSGASVSSPSPQPQLQSAAISSNTGRTVPTPASPAAGGVTSPAQAQTQARSAEKRPLNGNGGPQSVTVDLTDDEPPAKQPARAVGSLRVVPQQQLVAPPRASAPRKVYIPISGTQTQTIRPGQTIMFKNVVPPSQRARNPGGLWMGGAGTGNMVRLAPRTGPRHPAPLPEAPKQAQPPNWKTLPPAPDLKISKVENGIVISWKIDGYQEDTWEEIASYQLYAYQETSTAPSTMLWKKIGDVKALPLPMACTLTQFMAGYKYYFAVRAVDIRSRIGPFSLPGSILLLNK